MWKIEIVEVNGNSLLEFVCNGDVFKDMHLLKFIIMVRNSTSLLLVSKMKLSMHMCQSFLSWCTMFVYGTTLKIYGCHPRCGTSFPITWRGSGPLQKLFEPIILLPPYKTPWTSKLEIIISWNCQFAGVMKNTFLPPYTPLGLMSISSSRHWSWEHDELLAS